MVYAHFSENFQLELINKPCVDLLAQRAQILCAIVDDFCEVLMLDNFSFCQAGKSR